MLRRSACSPTKRAASASEARVQRTCGKYGERGVYLVYRAMAGEVNTVVVTQLPDQAGARITDSSAVIRAGAECRAEDAHSVVPKRTGSILDLRGFKPATAKK